MFLNYSVILITGYGHKNPYVYYEHENARRLCIEKGIVVMVVGVIPKGRSWEDSLSLASEKFSLYVSFDKSTPIVMHVAMNLIQASWSLEPNVR